MQKCNSENGRLPCSGFDNTCRRYLSRYMIWIGTCRKKHGKCIVKDHNNNVHWSKLEIFTMNSCVDFFEKSVVEISTSNSTAKKHKYAIQKYLDVIEQKEITLKDNLKIKLSLNTQLEWKKQLAISKRHATDAHSKIPLKCL